MGPSNNHLPLLQAIIVFCMLIAVIVFIGITIDLSLLDKDGLLLTLAFLCCVLIAKNVYDSNKSLQRSEALKQSLTEDMAFASKELYIELYQNSPVPYLLIDHDGTVESANVAAARMLGIPQARVQGVNIFSYLRSDNPSHLDLLIEKYRNGVAVGDETMKVIRPDKAETWALMSLFLFTSTPGKSLGLLTLVDITKQKRIENAKSQFVSLASHQLRTPIAGMKWSAELLQIDNPEGLTERQQKYIDRLLTSINRMALLVDDFLRVSRFELGTFQPEYATVHLETIVNEVIEEQTPRVKQKDIEVKTFFDPSLTDIVTDPNLLRMVTTNLFTNAVKYTRPQGTIHIGYARKDDEITITVADNGMGIPVQDQDRIFSKLFRASNAVRDVPDGTGLGLYIVREAVRVLKGHVSFTSAENVGTTFEIVLPLLLPDHAPDQV